MKKIFLILSLGLVANSIHAQTFAEWFEQKKTRIQYLAKQIAALQVYITDAEKGYKIVEDGVHTIGDIKNGEFNLHSVFFASLKTVSPEVKNMAEVAEIIALQTSIINQFSAALRSARSSGVLQADELGYFGKVYSTLVNSGLNDLTALTTLLTDDALGMDDGERIRRVREIDADMKEQYSFMKNFTGESGLLVLQRQRDQSDAATLQQLYGIPEH